MDEWTGRVRRRPRRRARAALAGRRPLAHLEDAVARTSVTVHGAAAERPGDRPRVGRHRVEHPLPPRCHARRPHRASSASCDRTGHHRSSRTGRWGTTRTSSSTAGGNRDRRGGGRRRCAHDPAAKHRELEPAVRDAALPGQRRVPRAEHAAVRPGQPRPAGRGRSAARAGAPARAEPGPCSTPRAFARLAEAELDLYRAVTPDLPPTSRCATTAAASWCPTAICSSRRPRASRRTGLRRCSSTRSARTSSPTSTARASRCGCSALGSPATTRPRKAWPCSPSTSPAG